MYNQILDICKQIEVVDTSVISLLAELASRYYDERRYEKAELFFENLLTLDPNQSEAYLDQGYVYLWLMKGENACKSFASYASLRPRNVNAAWMAVYAAFGKQPPETEIAERLETIAMLDPQREQAYICRGVAMGLRGKWQDGLTELEYALHLFPNSEDAWFWKGMACAYLEDNTSAVESIEQALQNGLPPLLLTPLFCLEQDRPQFYQEFGVPLLKRYELV